MTPRRIAFAVIAAVAFAAASSAAAESGNLAGLFNEANTAFWAGDYAKAASTYARLEELGASSAELSYNRATAEARLGNLGRAVQYYERVLRREPGHEDAVQNLSIIREYLARRASEAGRNADLAPATTAWRALLDRFSPRSAAFAFLLFHLALFSALVARRFARATASASPSASRSACSRSSRWPPRPWRSASGGRRPASRRPWSCEPERSTSSRGRRARSGGSRSTRGAACRSSSAARGS